jgi:hypothetical protein
MTTTLETLDTDHSHLPEVADRLLADAPDVAALIAAMGTFLLGTDHRVTRLPDQTAGLDYSDLAILLALVNDTRDRLAQILDHITGDDSDTERINTAWTALQDAATPLSSLVSDLYTNA